MASIYMVWVDSAYDSRDFYGAFYTEESAQFWIDNNLDSQESKHAYVEICEVN